MTEWLDLDPVEEWEETEATNHSVAFEHPVARERLIALRVRGPAGQNGSYYEDYVLRHIPEDRESTWQDLGTFKEISTLEERARETMQQLAG